MSTFDDFMIAEATKKNSEIGDLVAERDELRKRLSWKVARESFIALAKEWEDSGDVYAATTFAKPVFRRFAKELRALVVKLDMQGTSKPSRPMPQFKGATCKGSYLLGSACGHCERCERERGAGQPER